jgi:hypothetical protein
MRLRLPDREVEECDDGHKPPKSRGSNAPKTAFFAVSGIMMMGKSISGNVYLGRFTAALLGMCMTSWLIIPASCFDFLLVFKGKRGRFGKYAAPQG